MTEPIARARLIAVPTPIGNLEDISFRAVRLLKECDLILAEDTRTTGKLLKHYEIAKPMQSYHAFNEHKSVAKWADEIEGGKQIALVSDAGTPGISDPGFLLIRECVQREIPVETLPGATAFVPALVSSGLPCDKFIFEGFLPVKKGRQTRLKILAEETRTVVLYESPHRIVKCLTQLSEHFGADRQVVVARELTKLHEQYLRGSIAEVIAQIGESKVKGEIVMVIAGKTEK